jgi:anti-sigma factor RsiW
MNHMAAQQLLAVYALGACEEAEKIAVESHLTRCPSCVADLQSLAAAVHSIEIAPATPPPPGLRTRVLRQAMGLARPAGSSWGGAVQINIPDAPRFPSG